MFSDSATSALSCVLFQHLSKPNNLSPVFVALLWQCFCCVALPVQLHALPVWYHRWAQLQEHQWNPWEAEGEVGKQIKSPVTATDLLILTVIHIGLPLFFFWWKEAEKKGPLLATSLGQLLTFFTVQFTAGLELLLKDYPEHSVLLPSAPSAVMFSQALARQTPYAEMFFQRLFQPCVCVLLAAAVQSSQSVAEVWGQQCHLFLFQSALRADVCTIFKKGIYSFAFHAKE